MTRLPWYRRSFAVPAPLGGLAAAAALAGIAAIGVLATREQTVTQVAVSPSVGLQPVVNVEVDRSNELQPTTFILTDPTAKRVVLIGDFNDWDANATPMVFDSTHAAWSVTLPLLPGLHQYQFLIDGTRHVNDPVAPQMSGDFGSPNSVVTVRIPQR